MKHWLLLVMVFGLVAGCDSTPVTSQSTPAANDAAAPSQQDEIASQKLTIEQAAEAATKRVEADAKAEIDEAAPVQTDGQP